MRTFFPAVSTLCSNFRFTLSWTSSDFAEHSFILVNCLMYVFRRHQLIKQSVYKKNVQKAIFCSVWVFFFSSLIEQRGKEEDFNIKRFNANFPHQLNFGVVLSSHKFSSLSCSFFSFSFGGMVHYLCHALTLVAVKFSLLKWLKTKTSEAHTKNKSVVGEEMEEHKCNNHLLKINDSVECGN